MVFDIVWRQTRTEGKEKTRKPSCGRGGEGWIEVQRSSLDALLLLPLPGPLAADQS